MKDALVKELEAIRSVGQYRFLRAVSSDQGPEIIFEGKRYLNFSSNNYLGLANHPEIKLAAIRAIKEYGTGSGASRLITGSMTLHHELEKRISEFKGTEAALLFNSGYQANTGAIQALVGEGDVIFSDALNHASLIDGCRLSRAQILVYRHKDVGHLEELLGELANGAKARPQRSHVMITDSVFSMDGDLAPLPALLELAEKYDAWLYVDEAHATGIFGKRGRGLVEHFGIPSDHPRLIQMGTLGKALGSFGAYIAGPYELIDFLINRARPFIYTTALPPAVCAASIAALDLVSQDLSFKEKLVENINYFSKGLAKISTQFKTSSGISPIFPLIIGEKTMEASESLFEQGIWAQGIRPPTVPEGTSRIRLTLMASHTKEHLDRCLEALESYATQ